MIDSTDLKLIDTVRDEIGKIYDLENKYSPEFIIQNEPGEHLKLLDSSKSVYKSIYYKDKFIGFILLIKDGDQISVEFRRIVIDLQNQCIGKLVLRRVDRI
ncbi:hypothetical protein [Gracilimonas sp.]|uniref:hypothetical protein n=1 Tax=Gracilimonas sp. TaxID=1974203 RepID=UPI0032EAA890